MKNTLKFHDSNILLGEEMNYVGDLARGDIEFAWAPTAVEGEGPRRTRHSTCRDTQMTHGDTQRHARRALVDGVVY